MARHRHSTLVCMDVAQRYGCRRRSAWDRLERRCAASVLRFIAPDDFVIAHTSSMSTIGFIINGVRKGSFIAPEWWPDAGMTVWIFATSLNKADMQQMSWRLKQVQWCVA